MRKGWLLPYLPFLSKKSGNGFYRFDEGFPCRNYNQALFETQDYLKKLNINHDPKGLRLERILNSAQDVVRIEIDPNSD